MLDRTVLKTSAPNGPRMPQMPTAPDDRNPPVGHIESVGARVIASS